jgi:hypothetical protein
VVIVAIPTNGETWLICGGRDFADQAMFDGAMYDLLAMRGCPTLVVHGAARGADSMADAWARKMGCQVVPVPANWQAHGKAAGPMRNQKMLDRYRPHFVVAFPGGSGTADMVRRAEAANVTVAEIRPTPKP